MLLEQKYVEKPGDPPPHVGGVVLIQHGPTPLVDRVTQILPPLGPESGTLVLEPPFA